MGKAKVPFIAFQFTDPLPGLEESLVVDRASRGDALAQQSLIARYGNSLVSAIVKRKRYEEARESAADAFRKVFEAMRKEKVENFWALLLTAADRQSKTRWKKEGKLVVLQVDAQKKVMEGTASTELNVEMAVDEAEQTAEQEAKQAALEAEVLASVPLLSRMIFAESETHGRRFKAIAPVVGKTRKEVEDIVRAIRRKMGRKDVAEVQEEEEA